MITPEAGLSLSKANLDSWRLFMAMLANESDYYENPLKTLGVNLGSFGAF
jgi:hypothetical protein